MRLIEKTVKRAALCRSEYLRTTFYVSKITPLCPLGDDMPTKHGIRLVPHPNVGNTVRVVLARWNPSE